MTRRIIYILIWVIACTLNIKAQDSITAKLLKLEHEIFMSNDEIIKNNKINEKLFLLVDNNLITERALIEIKRINPKQLDKNQQTTFYWNAALIAYLNKDNNYANYAINNYHEITSDSSYESILLQTLISAKIDTSKAKLNLNKLSKEDSSLSCLSCLVEVEKYQLKNKKLLLNSSKIIPGLGSMLNGNVLKGFTSLALTSSCAVLTYYLFQNKCYVNSVGLGLTLGTKFYSGNVRLTEKLVNQKEYRKKNELNKNCELAWKSVFEKYPLQLK